MMEYKLFLSADVPPQVVRLLEAGREVVQSPGPPSLDGADYHYTRWTWTRVKVVTPDRKHHWVYIRCVEPEQNMREPINWEPQFSTDTPEQAAAKLELTPENLRRLLRQVQDDLPEVFGPKQGKLKPACEACNNTGEARRKWVGEDGYQYMSTTSPCDVCGRGSWRRPWRWR